MNAAEQELVAYLTTIKDRQRGFIELHTDLPDQCVEISLDASYDWFGPECIFDDCTDAQAKLFLEAFLTRRLRACWTVSTQLSKLLAVRGRLVSPTMDSLLTRLDWSAVLCEQLFLSYLCVREDGVAWAIRLLDQVREDARDGLFLACYRLQSAELDRKLIASFLKWHAEDDWSGSGTGELYALSQFIGQWLDRYPYPELEGVIRLYFKFHQQV